MQIFQFIKFNPSNTLSKIYIFKMKMFNNQKKKLNYMKNKKIKHQTHKYDH